MKEAKAKYTILSQATAMLSSTRSKLKIAAFLRTFHNRTAHTLSSLSRYKQPDEHSVACGYEASLQYV